MLHCRYCTIVKLAVITRVLCLLQHSRNAQIHVHAQNSIIVTLSMQYALRVNQCLMLQALDSTAPCSSVLAPFADAVFELMDSFESADIEVGDTSDTWGVYKSAAWVCRKTWRGEKYHMILKRSSCMLLGHNKSACVQKPGDEMQPSLL